MLKRPPIAGGKIALANQHKKPRQLLESKQQQHNHADLLCISKLPSSKQQSRSDCGFFGFDDAPLRQNCWEKAAGGGVVLSIISVNFWGSSLVRGPTTSRGGISPTAKNTVVVGEG